MKQFPVSFLLFGALLFAPEVAIAHVPFEGFHNFYNGLLHPVFVPAHVMLLIAIGLLFGQRGLHDTQMALVLFWVSAFIGIVAAWFSLSEQAEVFVLVNAAIISLLVAASLRLPLHFYSLIGIVAGFSLGLDSSQDSLLGSDKLIALVGSGIGIAFFSLYPIIFAKYWNKKSWQRIGLRIIGSWVAASSLLVLALSLSSKMT
jgi:hydrogenase/urease accessory protein HupE